MNTTEDEDFLFDSGYYHDMVCLALLKDVWSGFFCNAIFVLLSCPCFAIQDSATQPSLVIVYFGGNDSMGPHSSGLGPHVPFSEYVENMKKIASHLKVLSSYTIYLKR